MSHPKVKMAGMPQVSTPLQDHPLSLGSISSSVRAMRVRGAQLMIAAGLVTAMTTAAVASGSSRNSNSSHKNHIAAVGCRRSQLTIAVGSSFAGLGTAGANIRFINDSARTCSLRGWPNLSLRTSGTPTQQTSAADAAAASFPDVRTPGEPTVILKPGQRADAIFAGPDGQTTNNQCGSPYRTIRVSLPGSRQGTTLSAWISWLNGFMPSCGQTIRVSPVLPSASVYKG
jgi:hypothetical protein